MTNLGGLLFTGSRVGRRACRGRGAQTTKNTLIRLLTGREQIRAANRFCGRRQFCEVNHSVEKQ